MRRGVLILSGLLFAVWVPVACSDGDGPTTDAGLDAGDSVDAGLDAGDDAGSGADQEARVVDTAAIYLEECKAFNLRCEGAHADDPLCGACQLRIRYRADACSPEQPCDDLFLFWAAVHCDLEGFAEMSDEILAAQPGFVTACVQPIYPGEILPGSLGAPERDEAVMDSLFQSLRPGGELAVWNGENLLMGGCSMGATRYPVVAARYEQDALWLGNRKTAVCMSDGVVDIGRQDRFVGEGTGPSCAARHRRIVHAYTVVQPMPGHACQDSPQGQCACDPAHVHIPYTGDCAEGDCVSFDSIVVEENGAFVFSDGVTAGDFAVPHWKLITEGGFWADDLDQRCENDVVDGAPFVGLCQLLDADEAHHCVHESFPDALHCRYYNAQINELCINWFMTL